MDRFEKVKVLGRGAFGLATLVKLKNGEHRVVKQVDLSQLTTALREAAHKEVGVLRQLTHPHIVGYFDTFIEHVTLYIVMEFADAGDLSAQLRARQEQCKPYEDSDALKIFGQSLLALRYIHSKRIIHRDIKCQNIFLMKGGDVKVGDFGISKFMETTTAAAGTTIGTPSYFAPEVCEDRPYNSKVDVWSMGVVLYELVVLKLPFQASNVAALVIKIVTGEPAPLPEAVGPDVRDLIKRTLQKKPEDRPSADDLLQLPALCSFYCTINAMTISGMSQFEKVKILGRGAFGVAILVKRLSMASDMRLRVVKMVEMSHLPLGSQVAAKREVNLLRRLSHPHIIAYFDAFVENETLHLVLEYADGGDLATDLREKKEIGSPYDEIEAIKIFGQCLLALRYLHAKRIVHRDVKSLNVFLMKTREVKLGDFGISKVMDGTLASPQTLVGTPSHLAPEMCKNLPYDGKVDIWSLGVLFYEVISFEHPFQGSNIAVTIMKIVKDEPSPDLKQGSDELRDIVRKTLLKNPELRPSAEDLLALPVISSVVGEEASREEVYSETWSEMGETDERTGLPTTSSGSTSFACIKDILAQQNSGSSAGALTKAASDSLTGFLQSHLAVGGEMNKCDVMNESFEEFAEVLEPVDKVGEHPTDAHLDMSFALSQEGPEIIAKRARAKASADAFNEEQRRWKEEAAGFAAGLAATTQHSETKDSESLLLEATSGEDEGDPKTVGILRSRTHAKKREDVHEREVEKVRVEVSSEERAELREQRGAHGPKEDASVEDGHGSPAAGSSLAAVRRQRRLNEKRAEEKRIGEQLEEARKQTFEDSVRAKQRKAQELEGSSPIHRRHGVVPARRAAEGTARTRKAGSVPPATRFDSDHDCCLLPAARLRSPSSGTGINDVVRIKDKSVWG